MKEVISCSRRTDIPAFYYDWLQEGLSRGEVVVANPWNGAKRLVDLRPEAVHSICLWSRDYRRLLDDPGELRHYHLYFGLTITGLPRALEPGTPEPEVAVGQAATLAQRYGGEVVLWRFDPLLVGEGPDGQTITVGERLAGFRQLASALAAPGIRRCTVSLYQPYRKAQQRVAAAGWRLAAPDGSELEQLIRGLKQTAAEYGLSLQSCATALLAGNGLPAGRCIDGYRLEQLFGPGVSQARDRGQRADCCCTKSIDIGSYRQVCRHGCLYCYARPV
ncbi:MAG: DUF1848 family protein [Bacillota bacterium]